MHAAIARLGTMHAAFGRGARRSAPSARSRQPEGRPEPPQRLGSRRGDGQIGLARRADGVPRESTRKGPDAAAASAAKRSACTSAGVVCSRVAAAGMRGQHVTGPQGRQRLGMHGERVQRVRPPRRTGARAHQQGLHECRRFRLARCPAQHHPPHWRRNGKSSSSSAGLARSRRAGARVMMSGSPP